MLPEKLSNGLCSLNPGVDRAVLVCDMMVGTDGLVSAYQFYPALIHSHARLTYTAVWAALREKVTISSAAAEALKILRRFTTFIRPFVPRASDAVQLTLRRRKRSLSSTKRASLKPFTAETITTRTASLKSACSRPTSGAADFIGRKKAMSLFRIHEPPAADKLAALRATLSSMHLRLGGGDKPGAADFEKVLASLKESPVSDVVQAAMLRSMQRAVYSPDNCGHYGLNYPAYTHFTSPIRRYPDLLVHRTIRALLSRRKYSPVFEGDFTRAHGRL